MHLKSRSVALVAALTLTMAAGAAKAQTSAADKSSTMGLPVGSGAAASNGVGTSGSISGDDAGKASSTVAGVRGGSTGFGGIDKGQPARAPAEGDPALGSAKTTR